MHMLVFGYICIHAIKTCTTLATSFQRRKMEREGRETKRKEDMERRSGLRGCAAGRKGLLTQH